MNNPFDPERENIQHHFFNQICEAINTWMLEKYPILNIALDMKISKIEGLLNKFNGDVDYFRREIDRKIWASQDVFDRLTDIENKMNNIKSRINLMKKVFFDET